MLISGCMPLISGYTFGWFVFKKNPSLQEKPQEAEEVISESSSEEVEVRNFGG